MILEIKLVTTAYEKILALYVYNTASDYNYSYFFYLEK